MYSICTNIFSFNRSRGIFLNLWKSSNSDREVGSLDFFWAKMGQGGKRGCVVSGNGPFDSSDGEAKRRSFVSLSRRHSDIIALAENSRDRSIDPLLLVHDDRRWILKKLVPGYARFSLVFHDQLYAWRLLSLRVWRRAPPLLFEQISINSSMTVEFPSFSVGTTGRFVREKQSSLNSPF